MKGICVNVESGVLVEKLEEAIEKKPQVGMVMGGCNTVVVHEGKLLGDPIEILFYESSGWKYNHSLKMSYNSKKGSQQVSIRLTHPFRSDLKRMSAVCKAEGFEGQNGFYSVVKGAPEVIGGFLKNKPKGYDRTAFNLMKEGYRVLALAYKPLPDYDNLFVDRETLETDLELAGLLVLSCPMKSDTPQYIEILKNANYKNIMITGDNMFTAAKTGQDLKFGASAKNLFLRKAAAGGGGFAWIDIEDKEIAGLEGKTVKTLSETWTLCLEGPEMADLFGLDQVLGREVILRSTIFARVSPDQKEQIVKELKETGLKVLMCGDGTNDVGGLKKADVGIALVGIKDEPSDQEKNAEKERKKLEYNEAVRTRNFAKIKELANANAPTNDVSEFKSGDACIAAPFTNKYSNSLKCGRRVLLSGDSGEAGDLRGVHHDPDVQDPYAAVHDIRLHHEHAALGEPQDERRAEHLHRDLRGLLLLPAEQQQAREEAPDRETGDHYFQRAFLALRDRPGRGPADLHEALHALREGVLSGGRPEGDQRGRVPAEFPGLDDVYVRVDIPVLHLHF